MAGTAPRSASDLPAPEQSFEGAATPPPQQDTDLFAVAREAGCVLRNPVIEGRTHVAPDNDVEYKTNPPTSGNHDPVPAEDGVYSRAPTAKTMKHFVHTLEHGRIEIQYDPSLWTSGASPSSAACSTTTRTTWSCSRTAACPTRSR